MRKTEQRLWDRFRNAAKALHVNKPDREKPLLLRVENVVGVGDPDLNCLYLGCFAPIELKAVEAPPARATTAVFGKDKGLSVDQKNWHMRWRRYGGRSYILCAVGLRHFLIEGHMHDEFNSFTLLQLEAAAVGLEWTSIFERLGQP